jgi:hypothetical protein
VPIVIDIVNATDELLLRHYAEKQEWKQTQIASFNLNCVLAKEDRSIVARDEASTA